MDNALRAIRDNKEIFGRLYRELIDFNSRINVTAITDEEGVYVKHFADSLAVQSLIKPDATVCDVGTGGGFPSLPLAVVRPDLRITAIDSVGKKLAFVESFARENKLAVNTLHTRTEDYANGSGRERFDVVLARAVASLATLAEYCLPLVKVGGIFIAYKNYDRKETEAAAEAIARMGGRLVDTRFYALPTREDFVRKGILAADKEADMVVRNNAREAEQTAPYTESEGVRKQSEQNNAQEREQIAENNAQKAERFTDGGVLSEGERPQTAEVLGGADGKPRTEEERCRCLLIMEKIAPTPKGYPRTGNRAKEKPIGSNNG